MGNVEHVMLLLQATGDIQYTLLVHAHIPSLDVHKSILDVT